MQGVRKKKEKTTIKNSNELPSLHSHIELPHDTSPPPHREVNHQTTSDESRYECKKRDMVKNIQQRGFASGHPPDY
jgi:hypothetical protein